jgi:hypothetical protein
MYVLVAEARLYNVGNGNPCRYVERFMCPLCNFTFCNLQDIVNGFKEHLLLFVIVFTMFAKFVACNKKIPDITMF